MVETADAAALAASSRVDLLPLERGYAWGLGILAEGEVPGPEATAGIEDGRFCLEAPRQGLWKVVLRAPGFVPLSYSPLALTGSLELAPARLQRDAGARVEVRNAAGEPARGVWVVAASAKPAFWTTTTGDGWLPEVRFGRTGDDGRVTLPRAPGEVLELRAFVADSTSMAIARDDGLVAGTRLELPLPAENRAFEVRGERGEPLPGVLALLAAHGWPVAVSDAQGRLSLAVGSPDPVPLLLEGSDGRRRVTWLPAASEPGSGDGVTRLTLPPTPTVRGRAVDGERRRGLPGALVWLSPDPGTSAVTGAGGQYALATGGRERFRVQAEAAGFLPLSMTVGREDVKAGRVPVLVLQPAAVAVGKVVDAAGSALEGVFLDAVVETTPVRDAPGADLASRSRSGTAGRFELARMHPSVPYRVVARKPGFATLTLAGVVLAPGPRPTDLGALVLKPGASIEGSVRDARSRPLAGAEVRVRTAAGLPGRGQVERLRERPPEAVAGVDGRFVLRDLRPGQPVDLLTSRPGYLSVWTLGVEAPSAEPLTILLEEAAGLAGILVDEEDEPVAGVRVSLRWPGPPAGTVGLEGGRGGGSRSTETDARGEFSFSELAPGEVELSAWAVGFLPNQPTRLELPPAGEVSDVRLVLRRGATLEGRVLDSRDEPVGGTRLRAGTSESVSDGDGRYRLSGLPQGVLGLLAQHPDYRLQVREIDVEPGINAVDVVLEDGWSVSGWTLDETGDPVAGARVELWPEDLRRREVRAAASGEDGRFRVVVSEPGNYRLNAIRDGFAPGEIAGLEVRTPLEALEVVLTRGASVVGRLRGLEQEDLAWVTVEAQRQDRRGPEEAVVGTVDPRGRYAIHHLLAGSWRIRAALAGGRRQAEATVVVEAGVSKLERDLDLGGGLRFTGRLLFSGEPVAAAHVTLSGLDVVGRRAVVSGHDGAFRLEGLAAGRYRLDVLEPARALSHVEDLELTSDLDLVLEIEASSLAGRVVSAATGEPLEDALVYVLKMVATGEAGSLITVSTDATGSFMVAHLTVGRYLVSARRDGYAPAEQPLEVTAGMQPPPVLLRLAAAGGLTLVVSLESGGVPAFVTVSAFDSSNRNFLTDTKPVSDRGFVYFEQLPAGTWNLLVSSEGTAPTWISATVPGAVPEVVLPPAAPLTVRVPALMEADATGILTVAGQDGEPFFEVEPGGALRSRWTVFAGLVTLAEVPAGVWSLRVDGTRGGTWLGTAVTDGRTPSQVSVE